MRACEIRGFRLDADGHWVADLECGHSQHVRHEPPLASREWVLTEQGRASQVGSTLPCSDCEAVRVDAQHPQP